MDILLAGTRFFVLLCGGIPEDGVGIHVQVCIPQPHTEVSVFKQELLVK